MRRSPLERKTPIRKRSAKTARVYSEARGPLVEAILHQRPQCQARDLVPPDVCTGASEQVHERKTRARGGDILDERNCLALCARCHRFVHDNPAWSTQRGLLLHSWDEVIAWPP